MEPRGCLLVMMTFVGKSDGIVFPISHHSTKAAPTGAASGAEPQFVGPWLLGPELLAFPTSIRVFPVDERFMNVSRSGSL